MADVTETVEALKLLGYENPAEQPQASTLEKLVLKNGNLFAVMRRAGDVSPAGARDQGLFLRDTRFLSHFELAVQGGPAVLLSSQVSSEYITQIDLTVKAAQGIFTGEPVNYVHLRRSQLIDDCFIEELSVTNYLPKPLRYWVGYSFAADFADIFEVRGVVRPRRGTYLEPIVERDLVVWRYRGTDGRTYRTEIRFGTAPTKLTAHSAHFELEMQPGGEAAVELAVYADVDRPVARNPSPALFENRSVRVVKEARERLAACSVIETSDEIFNRALVQAQADLNALAFPHEGYTPIAAGIPWFAVPFGRDSLITAFEALPVAPHLARDSLLFLAAYQGRKVDPVTEEEPGKIPHELRFGEMTAVGETPHRPYYGSIDATPLFLVVLHEYLQWTDDRATVQQLLPAVDAALVWMEKYGDLDGDLFLEYQRKTEQGLVNQGWKDSSDGVCFPDGRPCEPPIALVEAQGYAVDALRRTALLFRALGIKGRAVPLLDRAHRLQQLIDEKFWVEKTKTFGIALDANKRLADTVTSNMGHLLFSRAAAQHKAHHVVRSLMHPAMFNGWGIRTLAEGQRAYNPLSYHNGTIWPHDNAMIAFGMAMYGFNDEATRVLDGLYHASNHFELQRLPELFCGLPRLNGEFPVHYPVACSPQAWASGAFFLLLRAVLGLLPDAPRRRLTIREPHLPKWVTELTFHDLHVGQTTMDLHFTRAGDSCFATVPKMVGPPVRVRIDLGRHH